MSDDSYMNKPVGQLTPEERKLVAAKLASIVEENLAKANLQWNQIQNTLNEWFTEFAAGLSAMAHWLEESSKNLKYPIGLLAQHGWYVSPDMPLDDSVGLAVLFREGKISEADNAMLTFFKQHETEIERGLLQQFPNRATIIRSAFNAHKRGDYSLSILAMITQADGICLTLSGTPLFKKREGVPLTSAFADEFVSDVFLSSILEPLRRPSTLSVNTSELSNLSGVLNRHGIVHGIITDYGSIENSYKAISLLQYVAYFVSDAVRTKAT